MRVEHSHAALYMSGDSGCKLILREKGGGREGGREGGGGRNNCLIICHKTLNYLSQHSWQYTDLFIFRFVSLLYLRSTLRLLDYTIRIGSTPTFLYFDLFLSNHNRFQVSPNSPRVPRKKFVPMYR